MSPADPPAFFLDLLERAVVRPLEALLDPLALVADGLDDDGHFCTHLGPPFFGASDRRGQSPRAAGDRRPRQLSQLETTVSRPFSLIHSVDMDGVGVAGAARRGVWPRKGGR